ncbi:unnamed protein product [Miscanthus lutarioriparius]|uniref:Uncharacterized protein n=1 Tax=Miscanthus lutarioriparius TaxID=422564 RepID=A0A811Q546_9POAL|nr:unnamed protein product [Miscanthus lutarioriparius]
MAEMISSAATGVLGSVIDKLAAMLTDKYNLARDVKQGIRSLQDELRTMEAMLLRLEDKDDDQIDPLAKDWRSKVRELSYDIEDCIDRFVLNHSHGDGGSTANFVHKAIQMVKTLFKDRGIAEEIRRLKRLVSEQSERGKRYYDINQCLLASSSQPVLLDPRAPALFQEARDLVGIDAPREEIISLLRCEDKEHKVVSIYGIGGQGKTTLAMEVYNKITEAAFDSRAFVSVSQTPDMKKLLRDILSQISQRHFDQPQMLETVEQLIRTVKECLKDKRYFILIDDIWNVDAWELVRSALPRNDNGSRIITTTRIELVAKSCCTGIAAQMYQAKPLILVNKHATEFLNSQVLRVLNIEVEYCECPLGHVKSLGQLKYLKSSKLPEDIEKLERLETLDMRWARLENLPTCIIQLHKLVRLFVHSSVRLPDGIGSLQALEEVSTINLGIQSLKFIQGLGDLTNLKLLKIDWSCSTELRDMEDHKVGPQISSLVNLTRLRIFVHGEAGKEGINILASLPMLLSLTVTLSNDQDGDAGILFARHAINRQGFQSLLKLNLRCWREAALEFEPEAMPKLQRLKLELRARCQFKFGEGGLVLGLQNLGLGLKHVAVVVVCYAAVADEVEALEDDIRGAAAVHPNRPILQIQRIHQDWMAQGCSRRPSDHAILEA